MAAKPDPIHIKPSHKGLLHRRLHIPAGKPIPEARLEQAEKSANPAERREATFAENARHFAHHYGPDGSHRVGQ